MEDAAKRIAALERELALERHRRQLAERRATVLRAAGYSCVPRSRLPRPSRTRISRTFGRARIESGAPALFAASRSAEGSWSAPLLQPQDNRRRRPVARVPPCDRAARGLTYLLPRSRRGL
jgi:hypothetical protein